MSRLETHIGCAGAIHFLIALACWTGFFSAIRSSDLWDMIVLGGIACLETILVLGIRFCITRQWVWYLGYGNWFLLLVVSLVPWVMMFLSPPLKDGIETGITLVFLPLLIALTAIPVAGIIHWNAIQVKAFKPEWNDMEVDE